MAHSLDEIQKAAANPNTIAAPGTYGEGRVVYASEMLRDLKQMVTDGKVTLSQYQEYAQPLIKTAQQTAMAIGGRGGSGAVWQSLINDGYTDNSATLGMPFTRQEYARLPNNVLPTQDDINSGMFDPTRAPLQRVQTAPTPQQNPGPGSQPGTTQGPTTPTNQTGTSPVFTANPNNPPPYGGLESNNQQANVDAQKIAQEAALQQQLAVQAANARATTRKQYLDDLSALLLKQENESFNAMTPDIQEDLNSKGLLRSTELGNAYAREKAKLAAQSANALAQSGLQGQNEDLSTLAQIQDTYNNARNSALQRQFSVEDYNRQIQAGQQLGEKYASLTPNQGKSGNPGAAAAGAIIGGLGAGIPTGGAAAPAGISAGAAIGNSIGGK